jgi:uncharacterized OB-fold protein
VKVEILRCTRCGTLDAGPRILCTKCHSKALEPHQVDGTGTLVSWTVIRRAPTKLKGLAPYAVCVVDLTAGVRVTGRLQSLESVTQPGAKAVCVALEGVIPIFASEAAW